MGLPLSETVQAATFHWPIPSRGKNTVLKNLWEQGTGEAAQCLLAKGERQEGRETIGWRRTGGQRKRRRKARLSAVADRQQASKVTKIQSSISPRVSVRQLFSRPLASSSSLEEALQGPGPGGNGRPYCKGLWWHLRWTSEVQDGHTVGQPPSFWPGAPPPWKDKKLFQSDNSYNL